MTTREDIARLANLARIRITEEETKALQEEIESILSYVSAVGQVSIEETDSLAGEPLKNVMREDANPHETGAYTEELLSEAPQRKDNALVVKKILSHGN